MDVALADDELVDDEPVHDEPKGYETAGRKPEGDESAVYGHAAFETQGTNGADNE